MWNRTLSKFERLKVFSIRNEQRRLYTSLLCVKSNIIKIRTFESIQHSKWTTKTLCKFFACEIEHYQNSNVWKYSAFEMNNEDFIQVFCVWNRTLSKFEHLKVFSIRNEQRTLYTSINLLKEAFSLYVKLNITKIRTFESFQHSKWTKNTLYKFFVCGIEHYQNSNVWKFSAFEINKKRFIEVSNYQNKQIG